MRWQLPCTLLLVLSLSLITMSGCKDASRPHDAGAAAGGQSAGSGGQAGSTGQAGSAGAPVCYVDFPCFGRTAVCVGDRQIQTMRDVSCQALCPPGPCSGGACERTGPIRECASGEICIDVPGSNAPSARCVVRQTQPPFCDDDAGVSEVSDAVACRVAAGCGDGKRNPLYEQCDDGNRLANDGCSADCALEPGWDCVMPTGPCRPARTGDADCTAAACRHAATCVEEPSDVACRCPTLPLEACRDVRLQSLGFLEGTNRWLPTAVSGDGSSVMGSGYLDTLGLASDSHALAWSLETGTVALQLPVLLNYNVVARWTSGTAFRWTRAGGVGQRRR